MPIVSRIFGLSLLGRKPSTSISLFSSVICMTYAPSWRATPSLMWTLVTTPSRGARIVRASTRASAWSRLGAPRLRARRGGPRGAGGAGGGGPRGGADGGAGAGRRRLRRRAVLLVVLIKQKRALLVAP